MTISTLVDLVKVYTPTSGQGALTLGAAVPGFLTPSSVIPAMTSGSLVSYGIADPSGNEVGQGILTLSRSVWTLTRGVTQSSNGGAPILCTGQATVALTLRAEDVFQGLTKLASGVITTPVAFIDFALPAGFQSFILNVQDMLFSVDDGPAMALRVGATFINDPNHGDSYQHLRVEMDQNAFNPPLGQNFQDGVIDATRSQHAGSSIGTRFSLALTPGSGSMLPTGISSGFTYDVAPTLIDAVQMFMAVNPSATVTPPTGAANLLRLVPYGNGDVNPPTSGETITAGSYIFWGISL